MKILITLLSIVLFFSCNQNSKSGTVEPKEGNQEVNNFHHIQQSCYKLSDERPIKPLNLNRNYKGRIVLIARYDTINNQFKEYEIQFAKLNYKESGKDFLSYNSISDKVIPAVLISLQPKLVNHLSYLRIVKTNIEGCTIPSSFGFPVRIE